MAIAKELDRTYRLNNNRQEKEKGPDVSVFFFFLNIYKMSSQTWMRCRKIGKITYKYIAKSSDILYARLM